MTQKKGRAPFAILMADDDADDQEMVRDALRECRIANQLYTVADGEQLLDYLSRKGHYADPQISPRPGSSCSI
jgi:CheY-like chemotaxis protein